MSRRLPFLALLMILAIANPVFSQAPPTAKKTDPLVAVLEKLQIKADWSKFDRSMSLDDLLSLVENYGLTMTLGSDLASPENADAGAQMLKLPRGQTLLGPGLQSILGQRSLTFLVKKQGLEVVSLETAAQQAKTQLDSSGSSLRLKSPLVSAVIVEKPLNEALAAISEDHDVTVVVAPQAGDARMAFVSARFLNVPLEHALDLLALQADLRVMRRGNAYYLTSPDQANQIRTEKLDQIRQQNEATNPPIPVAPLIAPQ